MNNRTPELLSPAGSPESLRAALAAGADAVYFGGTAFSNRMRARNFSLSELQDSVKLCHSCGAKAHITVNTRLRDRELGDAADFVKALYSGDPDSAPDALIVADPGLASVIRAVRPDAVLHASTQTSCSSVRDAEALASAGFSRLVLPREMSLGEIRRFTENSPLEAEIFIHGALCVSVSGQCLLSYVMGGRSGNRGECAQPCRLPYSLSGKSGDLLSISDLCLAGHIPEILDSGVVSLKIEGRLRPPSYVYAATSVYRRLLDERRNATEEELEILKNAFSRGSNDGYFTGRYKNMSSSPVISGASVPDGGAISEMIRKRTLANDRAVPLTAVFRMKRGTPSSLTLSSGETSVTVCGSVPEEASGHPMGAEQVSKNLLRFGGSGYSLSAEDTVFDIDSGLWMPVSEINSLRRNAVSALTDARSAASPQGSAPCAVTADAAVRSVHEKHSLSSTCEICDTERFLSSAGRLGRFMDRFDTVFVPFTEKTGLTKAFGPYADGKIGISLPVIEPDDGYVGRLLGSASSLGIGKALCHTPGQVLAASEKGFEVTASYRTNVTNTRAHGYYAGLGADTVILSPELPAGAVRKIAGDSTAGTGCVVYGRLPVMALSRCLLCRGNCVKGNTGGRNRDASPRICRGILKDRKNESFPVISSTGCVNVIYNSTPVWMGDMLGTLLRPHGRQSFHYIFTDETCAEALSAIEKYDAGQKGAGRRV